MTITSTKQQYNKIRQLINSSRFNESFALLKSLTSDSDAFKTARHNLLSSETIYRYLLSYLSEGKEDPGRDKILEDIREQLLRTNDLVFRNILLSESSDAYSSVKRMQTLKKPDLRILLENFKEIYLSSDERGENPLKITPQLSEALYSIFDYVWTMFGNQTNDYEILSSALTDEKIPDILKNMVIAAILLGNTAFYDQDSFSALLDAFDAGQSLEVNARLIVAITIILKLYYPRIERIENLRSRLLLMKENPEFSQLLNFAFMELVRTFDTARISSKMQNEIIPGLMKINPDIIDKMRNLASESEDFLSDSNPEWEEIIESSGIQDKIQEINDMQMEGADIMMTTFANLKTFPFFNIVPNWFLPFVPSYHEIESLNIPMAEKLLPKLSLAMCDSDIYSFLFSLKGIPADRSQMVVRNMEQQMQQAEEIMTSPTGDNHEKKIQRALRHFIRDIYRFFKLYRKKSDFFDPFSNPITKDMAVSLNNLALIDLETIRKAAEFFFKYGYHKEAATLFEILSSNENEDFSIWEKIGFCYERSMDYKTAVDWYKKAELINPGSHWLQKKLALCLKNAGLYSEAINYYHQVLEREPENYHLLMSAGQCLLEAGDYEKALQHFLHADYLKPERKDARRAIAWTRMLMKDYEKADSYFEKLTQDSGAEKTDFLNAALCAMASNNLPHAINLYRKFLSLTNNNDFRELMTALRDDASVIKSLGISSSNLRLVIDKLRYDLLNH